jgi:hypothetical protein
MYHIASTTACTLVVVFFLTPASVAQSLPGVDVAHIRSALLDVSGTLDETRSVVARERSVPLALGLSAIFPGAGQAYNRHWIKAGMMAATEIGLLTGYFVWDHRGMELEREYIRYAHRHWSPVQYSVWLDDYRSYLEEHHGGHFAEVDLTAPGVDFSNPASWSAEHRRMANAFFNAIRNLERQLFHPETGASFSHVLPYLGDQQYYELIGKYFQYAPGWDDYSVWRLPDGSFTRFIDPNMTDEHGNRLNASERFYDYARQHERSNDLLRMSQRVASFLLINHMVSAIDAAVNARLHNERLQTSFAFGYDATGLVSPVATVSWRL